VVSNGAGLFVPGFGCQATATSDEPVPWRPYPPMVMVVPTVGKPGCPGCKLSSFTGVTFCHRLCERDDSDVLVERRRGSRQQVRVPANSGDAEDGTGDGSEGYGCWSPIRREAVCCGQDRA